MTETKDIPTFAWVFVAAIAVALILVFAMVIDHYSALDATERDKRERERQLQALQSLMDRGIDLTNCKVEQRNSGLPDFDCRPCSD